MTRSSELAGKLADMLEDRTVAVAESCTSGALAAALAAGGHAQDWFRGGIISYQDEVKRSLLGVTASSMVTSEAATQMATGVRDVFDADVSVATTGVLGDEPVDGVDPSTVVVATLCDGEVRVVRYDLVDDPQEASQQATELALCQLISHLEDGSS